MKEIEKSAVLIKQTYEIFFNGVIIKEKRKKIRLGDELSLDGEVYKIIEAKK